MTDLCSTCHKACKNYKAPYLLTWIGKSNDIRKRPETCAACPKLAAWIEAWKVVKPKRLSPTESRRAMEDMLRNADISTAVRIVHKPATWRIIPIRNLEPPSSMEDDEVEEIIVPRRDVAISQAFHLEVIDEHFVLGGQKIRKTDEQPTRVSVYDLIAAVTGLTMQAAFTAFESMKQHHEDVPSILGYFEFPGQGRLPTPVTDARGMVMIINLLPGTRAAHFRVASAELMVRYLGGDKTLIDEINSYGELQGSTSESNIVSIFGEAVRDTNVKSITNLVVPPKTPGVYLANCSNPDTRKFVFDTPIPDGKDVIGYGFSAGSMYSRIEVQMGETGDYKFLDCFETPHASDLEQRLKDYVKFARLQSIKGTYTEPNGNKKIKREFFLASPEEYADLCLYMTQAVTSLEESGLETAERKHELAMEGEKTKQAEADCRARQSEADCKARQAEAEAEAAVEKERTRQKEIELEILRLQLAMR